MQWPPSANGGGGGDPNADDTLTDEEAAAYVARRQACMRRMSVDEKTLQNAVSVDFHIAKFLLFGFTFRTMRSW